MNDINEKLKFLEDDIILTKFGEFFSSNFFFNYGHDAC